MSEVLYVSSLILLTFINCLGHLPKVQRFIDRSFAMCELRFKLKNFLRMLRRNKNVIW